MKPSVKPRSVQQSDNIGTPVPSDGVPCEGVPSEGVPGEGVPSEGVPSEGVPSKGVPGEGVPSKGVPGEGVRSKGVPSDGLVEESGPVHYDEEGLDDEEMEGLAYENDPLLQRSDYEDEGK